MKMWEMQGLVWLALEGGADDVVVAVVAAVAVVAVSALCNCLRVWKCESLVLSLFDG